MTDVIRHSPMTDPGRHAGLIGSVPGDIDAILKTVRGLFVHSDYLTHYGLAATDNARDTLPVEQRLDQVLSIASQPLSQPRPYPARAVVTCRDYALLACGILRQHRIPARLRCGFATYLTPDRYEDHWICEYRPAADDAWRRADPQLDDVLASHLSITFDTADLPAGAFLAADEAWRRYRAERLDATRFGHGTANGEWFMWVNLARDRLARAGAETSPWDGWRTVAGNPPYLSDADRALCDQLAAGLEAGDASLLQPFWA